MTTNTNLMLCTPIAPATAVSSAPSARSFAAAARLRSAVTMSVDVRIADVPSVDTFWLGAHMSSTAVDAQAAKHGKAADPPRGTSV